MQSKLSNPTWQRLRLFGGIVVIGSFLLYLIVALSQAQHENNFSNKPLKDLKAMQANHPNDESLSYELAHSLQQQNKNDEARLIMEKLVRQQPRNLIYWQGLGRCAADGGHALEALDAYKKCTELSPSWGLGHLKRAEILAAAGLTTEALQEYDLGAKLDPSAQTNGETWARTLIKKGRYQEAWDRLVADSKQTMLSDGSYSLLTDVGLRLHRTAEVDDQLERRIRRTSLYPKGIYRLCQLRMALALQPDAETLANLEVVALDITQEKYAQPEFSAMLARIRLLRGNIKGAENALAAGLKDDHANVACLEVQADLYKRLGHLAQEQEVRKRLQNLMGETPALIAARKAAEAAPQDSAALLRLASALEAARKIGEAADAYETVLQSNPQDPTALAKRDSTRAKALDELDQKGKKIVAESAAQ